MTYTSTIEPVASGWIGHCDCGYQTLPQPQEAGARFVLDDHQARKGQRLADVDAGSLGCSSKGCRGEAVYGCDICLDCHEAEAEGDWIRTEADYAVGSCELGCPPHRA